MDTKQCPYCGKTITRERSIGAAQWERRTCCSQSCAKRYRKKPAAELKPCLVCGRLLPYKKSDSHNTYAARQYCSNACAWKARTQPKLCECGNPATHTIHFNILSVSHELVTETSLRVCADCHQYMLENDKGTW